MKKIHTVLAVIEPRQMRQPALMRALSLAQYARSHVMRDGLTRMPRIIAVMPVYDFSWDISSVLSIEQEQEMQHEVVAKHQAWLDAYLQVNAAGFNVESCVVWSKTVGKSITALAKSEGADLIVKTADVHGMLDSVLFTPLDWQLLANSPTPVYIAKDQMWTPTGTIAVAIAVPSENDALGRMLNMRMLREAQELARFTRCTVHLINAIVPVIPAAALDLPGYTPQCLSEENIRESCKQVLSFASRHNIPPERVHIREGHPDEVIPVLCEELKPTALFIGTSARRGLAMALLGNICQRVVDNLDCDVAVVTPKSVMRNVPTSGQSKVTRSLEL